MSIRNVPNFFLRGTISGRSTKITGGPQSKDGGFHLVVWIRDRGHPVTAVSLDGYAIDGKLTLEVFNYETQERWFIETDRERRCKEWI